MSLRTKRNAPKANQVTRTRKKMRRSKPVPKKDIQKSVIWCTCDHCVPEVDPAKRVCCGQIPATCDAVTNAMAIQGLLVLTYNEIVTNPDLWYQTGPPASVAVMTNRQKRALCYRKLFRLLYGVGQQGNKVPLPSCCRVPINNTYP